MSMTNNEINRARALAAVRLLDRVPDGWYVDLSSTYMLEGTSETVPSLAFQGHTQERCREIRALFPGTFWKKRYVEECRWWEYATQYGDIPIVIYAVHEAPVSCKPVEVEETYEAFELPEDHTYPLVKKTRKVVKYVCGSDREPDMAREMGPGSDG